MGEVYRAQDSRLQRVVAIKVLPESLAAEADRIARFEREAQLLASLSHPNIATVHDFQQDAGRHLLVMELVEGETLADRLGRGPLAVDEAIHIARQIAEALEAAHQRGIIHRDLKPANVKVTPDGRVKVLDFGLAKIFDALPGSLDAANSPTVIGGSVQGVILGTAAYMSPEQARGQSVDQRTDIWALGCVLYEMLTSARAFAGESLSDTVAAVLRNEPDYRALPAETPSRIRVLLRRCLEKDSRQRLHDVADFRIEIDDLDADAISGVTAPLARHHGAPMVVLAIVAGATLASAMWWTANRLSRTTLSPIHLSLDLPNQMASFGHLNASRELVISPDGQKIVYVAARGDTRQLYLRQLGQPEGKPIEGTDGATTALFSPDSEWVAFDKGSKLQKVALSGGAPVTLCTLSGTGFFGGDWGADGTIVFVPDYNGGLWTISASGGTPQLLLKTDVARDRVSYSDPQILPRGKGVLLTLASGHAVSADDQDIAVLESGSKEPRILIRGGSHPRYLPTGHIVYVHAGALLATAFDVSTLAVTGTPVSLVEGLAPTWSGDTDYSISANGTLVYAAATGASTGGAFVLVDRKGNVQPTSIKRGNYSEFAVAPNGRSIATRVFAVNDDVWTYDVATGAPLRLTFEPLDEIFPHWTADGTRIAFGTRTGTIFWKAADGSGQREELTSGAYPRYPVSFSRDGKRMLFVELHPSRRGDIWSIPLEGDRRPEPLIATDADEGDAEFSPDARWVAYVSDETGRSEVFLRPIGARGGRRQVSSDGGRSPHWSPTTRELFFTRGGQLVVVTIDEEGNPVGHDRVLFSVPPFEDLHFAPEKPLYTVMPDGEHFLFLLDQSSSPNRYNVVLNWFEELKARVPVR